MAVKGLVTEPWTQPCSVARVSRVFIVHLFRSEENLSVWIGVLYSGGLMLLFLFLFSLSLHRIIEGGMMMLE